MPEKEMPRCGSYQAWHGQQDLEQRGGCGGQVEDHGHLLRWYRGEDFVTYHQKCFEILDLPLASR